MSDKKWYIVCQHSEGSCYGIVALTDDELAGAKKMLDYEVVIDGSYCEGIHIYDDEPYDTEEQARNAVLLYKKEPFCPNGSVRMDSNTGGKVNEPNIEVSRPDGNCLDCKFQYLEDSDYWCSICPGNPEDI